MGLKMLSHLILSLAMISCHHFHSVHAFLPSVTHHKAMTLHHEHDINIMTSSKTIQRSRFHDLSLKLSPSGIDEWPQIAQATVFFSTYAALAIVTVPTTKLIENFSKSIGMEQWRLNVIDTTLPVLLGLFYSLAGIGHFVDSRAFANIYPPIGTWGLWYVPGSAEFHVAWTGIVELLAGMGMLMSVARGVIFRIEEEGLANFIKPISASVLFFLTLLVTPANIYMFTHGAVMGDDMQPLDVSFHMVRFGVQALLLNFLATLARDGFFFAWGEEID